MAECNREQQEIAAEIEAVQNILRLSAERQAQGQKMQAAEMNAMGYRLMEMKDLLIQREYRMESQLQEMCSQIQAIGTVLIDIQPQTENTAPIHLTKIMKGTPPKHSTKNVTLKSRENSTTPMNVSTSKPVLPKYKPLSCGIQISTTLNTDPSPSATCKKGSANDPITIEISSMGFTDSKLPTCSTPTSQMTTTFQSGKATLGEKTEEFHTATDDLPPGNPCASSTRRKEVSTHGTSNKPLKSTRGSEQSSPPAPAEEISIYPEQLNFTEAISKQCLRS